jgi:hypothetical protein
LEGRRLHLAPPRALWLPSCTVPISPRQELNEKIRLSTTSTLPFWVEKKKKKKKKQVGYTFPYRGVMALL